MADVLWETDSSGVMLVTLNRPDQLNTLGGTIVEDFAAAMDEASTNPAVRAVAVTGAGRAFCAGAQLTGTAGGDGRAGGHLAGLAGMDAIHRRWAGAAWACPKPTVALINGAAAGAGLGLALSLDFRIAAQSALLVSAFSKVALSGDNGVTYALAHLMGRSAALEILMLSPRIDAQEAEQLGLVRDVVPDGELLERGMEFARRLAGGPTTIYALMKRNLAFAESATFEQSLDREASGIAVSQASGDFRSAVEAFLQKRPAVFG